MSPRYRWYEDRERAWHRSRGEGDQDRDRSSGPSHDYDRYPDEGYRGRDDHDRPYGSATHEERARYGAGGDERERGPAGPRDQEGPSRGQQPYDAAPYGFGAGYGREGNRGGGRDWWDRTRDEMASWFGDRNAERRRDWDEIRGEHRGRGPSGYERSDDRIREDVNDRLTDDSWLDASNVEVSVQQREVTLSGTIASREDKRRAEDLADSVPGVTHVQNNLRVGSVAIMLAVPPSPGADV